MSPTPCPSINRDRSAPSGHACQCVWAGGHGTWHECACGATWQWQGHTGEGTCGVNWGTHGCRFDKGHDEPHECDCCECPDHAASNIDDEGAMCAAKPPYYGPETYFYGEDARPLSAACDLDPCDLHRQCHCDCPCDPFESQPGLNCPSCIALDLQE